MEKKERKGIDIGSLGPGESREFNIGIPIKDIEEAKRRGKTTLKFEMKYSDSEGNSYTQTFELDLNTGEVKEVIDVKDLDNKNRCGKRPILDISYEGMSRVMRKR